MRASLAVFGALAGLAMPAELMAQGSRSLLAGAEFRSVTYGAGIGTKSVSELAVPIGASVPLGRRVGLDVGTYFVTATRKDEAGGSASVSGLTDVILRGSFQIKPDVAILTMAVNLPAGTESLDGQQRLVASATATDLIPYPVQNFGSGLSLTTGLALAAPVGSWALGLAGSFRYNGSYEPFADTSITLKPGAEMRLRLGADRIVGQGRVSIGVTYSTFSTDEFGTTPLKPGSRFIPQLSWSIPLGNNSLALYAWDIYRNVEEDTTIGTAKENTIVAGAVFSLRTGRHTLRPMVEYRKAWVGPGGLQPNGTLFGFGARYSIAASDRVSVVPGLRVDVGSLPNGTSNVSFTGFTGSLTFRAGW